MKLFTLAVLLSCFSLTAQNDYILEVDGKTYEVALDAPQKLTINGKQVNISVKKKDTLLFNNPYFSFKHLKKHDISNTNLDEGIQQFMMMTAAGSGVIIQTYNDMDPAMLKELMLNEMTKESIGYGYSVKREDYTRTLSNGLEMKVLKAVLEYKGEVETYEVATYSKKDEGFLIVTMNTVDDFDVEGKDMIKLVWNTLVTN
ncbi:hypothetical protein [Aurantibacter aestuarii]|uniref:DUF1795 domain-containing protein n=1 Tax=Aurantibacter aestuarii TaxID=1266046 RepID=A0A2T1NEF7_9FLAO|nr:hypothetical protein [Aurantibacter aestuarii]PSG90824.1 hypothetical protein C7H52_06000 [Aurantibacter aestuarii]